MIEAKGIKPQSLNFTFRIMIEGVEYGFPCKLDGNKVSVRIPPLADIVKENLENGNYDAKLEVTGEDKYYLKPFSESIKVKIEPKVEIEIAESKEDLAQDIKEASTVIVSSIIEEDIDHKKPVNKPKSKLAAVL